MNLEQLENRDCPSIIYHGGEILVNPKIANIFIGTYDANIDWLTDVMVTDYVKYIGIYGIGQGVHDATIVTPDYGSLDYIQIGQLLTNYINAGLLPYPDDSQMYMVYNGDTFYHYYFNLNGVNIPFGVSGDDFTGSSHEILETITDPILHGWFEDSPQTGEIGDLGKGVTFNLDGIDIVQPLDYNHNYISNPTQYIPVYNGLRELYNNIVKTYYLDQYYWNNNDYLDAVDVWFIMQIEMAQYSLQQ